MKNSPVPVIVSWSGGKDSALTLHALQRDPAWQVRGLLTSVNRAYGRISMHGVRETLLDAQAASLGLPLYKVQLPERPSNDEYEAAMAETLDGLRRQGIMHVAFGDLFLEDIRRYRKTQLARVAMQGVFPLWLRPTAPLAREFLALGFKAALCCVDGEAMDGGLAGREYDAALLQELPAAVDPCGENGEFHTFVYAGPLFRRPLVVRRGERVLREARFYFCDLLLEETGHEHLEPALQR